MGVRRVTRPGEPGGIPWLRRPAHAGANAAQGGDPETGAFIARAHQREGCRRWSDRIPPAERPAKPRNEKANERRVRHADKDGDQGRAPGYNEHRYVMRIKTGIKAGKDRPFGFG